MASPQQGPRGTAITDKSDLILRLAGEDGSDLQSLLRWILRDRGKRFWKEILLTLLLNLPTSCFPVGFVYCQGFLFFFQTALPWKKADKISQQETNCSACNPSRDTFKPWMCDKDTVGFGRESPDWGQVRCNYEASDFSNSAQPSLGISAVR